MIQLVIHQFKCHANLTFEFTQALVCGASGAGKTTLLEAIRYALTGVDAGDNEARVDLISPECTLSRSTAGGLHVGAMRGEEAQEYIDACFKFYADKPVNEILFPPGRPTPAELRERCALEIRALESDLDQLKGAIDVLERDVGTPPKDCLTDAREYLYLKHKQFLYTSYVQKVDHYQQELQTLQCEAVALAPGPSPISYSTDQLERHVCAERELTALNWTEFLQYSVEDCREMVDEYSVDLERARNPYSPQVHQALEHEYNDMCVALLPCPSCNSSLAVRNNSLFIATPDCQVVPHKQVAECKTRLDAYSALNPHDQPEESADYLATQLAKWKHYLTVAEAIRHWRPALLEDVQNSAELLRQIQRSKYIEERKTTLIEWISRLNEEAARINLVDYSSTLAFDMDRYQELLRARAAAEKISRRKAAAEQLQQMILVTENKYRTTWLTEVETRMNALCKQVFQDEFVVQIGGGQEMILNRGMQMTPSMLSSGEYARYNLCYTLAVAQQCGSRILLLDEVLVHLDSVARQRTLEMLQQQTGSMYLLFVSHDTDVPFLTQTLHMHATPRCSAALK